MRIVTNEWIDLASGFALVTRRNAELKTKWSREIDLSMNERFARDRVRWSHDITKSRRNASGCHWPCGISGLVAGIVIRVSHDTLWYVLGYSILTLAVLTLCGLYARLGMLKRAEPTIANQETQPLDIVATWWKHLETGAVRVESDGDPGEVQLLSELKRTVSDQFVCVRSVLVAQSLDADIIVVGPSSLWIFECKHWTGTIVCQNGEWSRLKDYHERGGTPVQRQDSIRHSFDTQWLRERASVASTLTAQIDQKSLTKLAFKGGIVFTHPDARWDIDRSCSASYGGISYWIQAIGRDDKSELANSYPGLGLLDTLAARAHKLDSNLQSKSSSSLIEYLARTMNERAASFVARSMNDLPKEKAVRRSQVA